MSYVRSFCECGCRQLAAGVVRDARRAKRVEDHRQVCAHLLHQADNSPAFEVLHRFPKRARDEVPPPPPKDYREQRMSKERRELRRRIIPLKHWPVR